MTDPWERYVEPAAEFMHEAYEDAAVRYGWATQERSRVPWDEVPPANRATMLAAVRALLEWLDHEDPKPAPEESPYNREQRLRRLLLVAADWARAPGAREAALAEAQALSEQHAPGVRVHPPKAQHHCTLYLPPHDGLALGTLAQCPYCLRWSFVGEDNGEWGGPKWVKVRWYHRTQRRRVEAERAHARARFEEREARRWRDSLQPPYPDGRPYGRDAREPEGRG
jgi:hypothetical protein